MVSTKLKFQSSKSKLRVRTGDVVRVLRGKDKGKTGKVMATLPREGRVLVEKVNMVHRHVRPRRAGEKGQRVKVAAPLTIANVQLVCPSCKKGSRIGIRRAGGKRERLCKKCGATL